MIIIILLVAIASFYIFSSTKSSFLPSHILIIRHANKVKEPSSPGGNALDNAPLDQEGKARAMNYINALYEYAIENYGENFRSAYAIKPTESYSMRPEQTVMPFCFTHNVPLYLPAGITDPYLFEKFRDATRAKENDNKPVLICFEHTCIQSLVKNFGFEFDKYWENDNYTCGIDINVQNGTYKIVYFPFVDTDKQAYLEYINSSQIQECK